MSPPFFRIITPKLLGFFRGGGGNVTSGKRQLVLIRKSLLTYGLS